MGSLNQAAPEMNMIHSTDDVQVHSVGNNLGKTTFQLVALGGVGNVFVRKKFTRKQL